MLLCSSLMCFASCVVVVACVAIAIVAFCVCRCSGWFSVGVSLLVVFVSWFYVASVSFCALMCCFSCYDVMMCAVRRRCKCVC